MTRKSGEHLRTTYGNNWPLFRPYQISSVVYTVISTAGDEPAIAEPKLYNWANSPYRTQVTPN